MTRRCFVAVALALVVAACAPDEGPGAGTSPPSVTDGGAPTPTEGSNGPYDY
jgi:hypothetical protein